MAASLGAAAEAAGERAEAPTGALADLARGGQDGGEGGAEPLAGERARLAERAGEGEGELERALGAGLDADGLAAEVILDGAAGDGGGAVGADLDDEAGDHRRIGGLGHRLGAIDGGRGAALVGHGGEDSTRVRPKFGRRGRPVLPSPAVDFVLPARPVKMQLVAGRGHYDAVIAAVQKARTSVWVASANLKEMMVEGPRRSARSRGRFRSILETFDELARAGVELRILHAKLPSGPFRERFDALPRLYGGGVELRECPRVHLKTVIVDGAFIYLGSANWTGAGLGAKGEGRRNFEVGMVSDDEEVIDAVQALYERIWTGGECGACKLREEGCEAPLDLGSRPIPAGRRRVARAR